MPAKLAEKVKAMVSPRWAAGESSAVQEGAITRINATPIPAMMRATRIAARLTAAVWSTTPAKQNTHAAQIPLIRPYLSEGASLGQIED